MTDDITQIPIKDYIEGIGIPVRKEGAKYFCSSPFSSDRNWSFCIYPTNTYFDWSSGSGGNIINLVSRLHNISLSDAAKLLRTGIKYEKYKPNYEASRAQSEHREPFDYEKYTNQDPTECEEIKAYAASRGITEGYFCGVFFERISEDNKNIHGSGSLDRKGMGNAWVRVPALGFLHVDKNLRPCGAKFRMIRKSPDSDQSVRFSARGSLGFYLLENLAPTTVGGLQQGGILGTGQKLYVEPVLYVVEGESNANAIYTNLKTIQKPSIILSTGGVSSSITITDLPEKCQNLAKKLVIDYDGNEELYQQRIKLYEELKAEPIKMILPKGEDINFLYCRHEMWKIEHLIM